MPILYHGELEDMSELSVDCEGVRLLLPMIRHVVNLSKNALHQSSRLPHLIL